MDQDNTTTDSSSTADDAKVYRPHPARRGYIERPFFGNELITFLQVDYGEPPHRPSRDIDAYETRPDGRLVAGSKRVRAHASAKEAQTSAAEMDVDSQSEDSGNRVLASRQLGGIDATPDQVMSSYSSDKVGDS